MQNTQIKIQTPRSNYKIKQTTHPYTHSLTHKQEHTKNLLINTQYSEISVFINLQFNIVTHSGEGNKVKY